MATLHNQDQVKAKDVRPGDTVIVRKAGDVIPEVVKSVLAERPKGLRAWKFPTKCPECGGPLVRLEGESDTFCTNVECPGQRWARICHFASRGAMDIEGLGERTVGQFLERNLIHDPGDIYTLDWDGVVARGLRRDLHHQPSAGDRGVEATAAGQPARRARHPSRRRNREPRARAGVRSPRRADGGVRGGDRAVEGIGQIIARSVHEFFANEGNLEVIEKLRAAG